MRGERPADLYEIKPKSVETEDEAKAKVTFKRIAELEAHIKRLQVRNSKVEARNRVLGRRLNALHDMLDAMNTVIGARTRPDDSEEGVS